MTLNYRILPPQLLEQYDPLPTLPHPAPTGSATPLALVLGHTATSAAPAGPHTAAPAVRPILSVPQSPHQLHIVYSRVPLSTFPDAKATLGTQEQSLPVPAANQVWLLGSLRVAFLLYEYHTVS